MVAAPAVGAGRGTRIAVLGLLVLGLPLLGAGWVDVTDARLHPSLLSNRKVEAVSDQAFRLWVTSIAWSAAHESDGVIPYRQVFTLHPRLGPAAVDECVKELVAAGLWVVPTSNGNGNGRDQVVVVHDFLVYNTSAEVLGRQREGNRQRQSKYRGG